MKTNKFIVNIALCALMVLAVPGLAAAQQMKTLPGHVPRAISWLHLQPIGDLPGDTNLNLAISLPVRNEQDLDSLLAAMYDPASTNFHHFLKPGEFAQRYGPASSDYQKVIDFANSNHLTVIRDYSNRMLLDVTGRASDIENAFHVKLRTYNHPIEHRTFFAPDSDPTVDSSVPIEHVSGLDNYVIPHPLLKETPVGQSSAGPKPSIGSAPSGQYMGKDFRAAYVPGVTLDGTGQKVALFELDGYYTADILSYESQAGLPGIMLTNIPVDGGISTPGGGDIEVSLDIEMVISMATNLSEVLVYEAPDNFKTPIDVLNRIASDDLANQISSSWGIYDNPGYDVFYKQMALQGQSFFQASGDEGAYYIGNPDWADDTNITLVGGTTLSTTGPGGAWSSETVWNWWSEYGFSGGGGGGTNINGVPIPFYQQNVPMINNMGSTTLRNVPDVALTADNIYIVYGNGQNTADFYSGGTSCAAPLWAGYTALINQQATNRDLPPVGFLNPAIYSIGLGPNYTNCFHDIVTGNNTNLVVGNAYFAVPGYDLASGWGTPNGSNLINALTTTVATNYYTHLSAPPPPYFTNLFGLQGGNPNGNWELFVLDNQLLNNGEITNGYSITLTTGNPIGYIGDDALTMSPSTVTILTNSDVTFTIGVTNYGPNTSSNVVVSDNLPLGFSLVNATPSIGTVTFDGTRIVWNVATNDLPDTVGGQLTLEIQAPGEAEQAQNAASVSAVTPTGNFADNSASATINVVEPTIPLLGSGLLGAGAFQFAVSGGSTPVVIQDSTNLVTWTSIYTNTPPFIFTNTIAPGVPDRFYRAQVQIQ
ncbi:MAG TPA: protease pro-enzyme activation domain-containing protein [Candidatus Sulfotelmatobacter sp.]|nr:protease pro-enzyme activation domain-containing protein [Candidatus Sulfotelmatobacter sp.]